MKTTLLILFTALSISISSQTTWDWAMTVDSNYTFSDIRDMSYDNLGNVVTIGFYGGPLAFANTTMVSTYGGADCFVASFTKSGTLNWMRGSGSTKNDYSMGICTDNSSNIYVVGTFSNTFNVGSSVLTHTTVGEAVFLLKYNPSGNVIWAKKIGQGRVSPARIMNKDGLLYLCGSFSTPTAPLVPSSIGKITLTSAGSDDAFVTKLDTSGNVLTVLQYGGSKKDNASGLSVTNTGEIIVSGTFMSPAFSVGISL